jgi:hypothetical protein
VHEDLLTYHSSFFRAALTGHFKEAENKCVVLEDDDPQVFELFVHWLYHKRFPTKDDAADLFAAWTAEDDYGGSKAGNLICLYVFCDKYDIPLLKIRIIDDLFDDIESQDVGLPSTKQVNFAFNKLPYDSPLCRCLVDMYCYSAHGSVWDGLETSGYPWPFLTRILQRYALLATQDTIAQYTLNPCDYHEHRDHAERLACTYNLDEC